MPPKGSERTLATPKRRKTAARLPHRHPPAGKRAPARSEQELLTLVRGGVERFILNNATVEEFLRTIRAVTEKEHTYSHQLTKSVFARIVKEAIRKRNIRRPK